MAEYINWEELYMKIIQQYDDVEDIIKTITEVPKIDIVRCKDCKHTDKYGYCNIIRANPPLLFYCRSGERKEKRK